MVNKALFAELSKADTPNTDDRGHSFITPIDGPIAGEQYTAKPGMRAIEKPPQYASVDDALNLVFSKLMERRTAAEILAYIEGGVPIDMLAHSIIMGGLGEGKWPVTAVHMMAGPITIMLIRMADAAKIKWNLSTDAEVKDKIPEIIQRLAAEKTKTGPADAAIFGLDKLQRGGTGKGSEFSLLRM